MKKILREPLFHFLIAGAAIFLLYSLIGETEKNDEKIVIDDLFVNHLADAYQAQWNRAPTPAELLNLIEQEIRLEVLYREALKLNLDRDDAVVKSRMEQKMEFLGNDLLEMEGEPGDDDLRRFYESHKKKYQTPLSFSFYQVGFSPKQGQNAKENAAKVLTQNANSGKEALRNYGSNLPFPYFWKNVSTQQIRLDLGGDFTSTLENAETGKWVGPLKSGFGEHLVYISERKPPSEPAFDEIRNNLLRDYQAIRKKEVQNEIYKETREKYEIIIKSDKLDKKLATKILNS